MRMVRLGDVAEMSSGATPSRGDARLFGGSVPWAKIEDLTRAGMRLTQTDEHVTDLAVRAARLQVFPAGTVLLAMYGSIGTASIAAVPTTSNQAILGIRCRPDLDPEYLWFYLRFIQPRLASMGRGGTQSNVNATMIRDVLIPERPLAEQRQIASALSEQLVQVARAREAVVSRYWSCRKLGIYLLRGALLRGHANWPRSRLGNFTDTRRSPSVTGDGEVPVSTITSGCLKPFGFSFDGLRVGRMSSRDAIDGVVAVDEVLVSRSNTEALVGRASRYPGAPGRVVATDLVFRLVPDPVSLSPDYLAGYLSVLQLDGYWRDRSSGASSTMKKITKSLLLDVEIPLPPLVEQLRIVGELHERMTSINDLEVALREEQRAIDAVPSALLRRAFEDAA
jgi:type I restriction enzyme, S subunit